MIPAFVATPRSGVRLRLPRPALSWLVVMVFGWRITSLAQAFPVLTNLSQLAGSRADTGFEVRLAGAVWWANPVANELVLHDASGTEMLECDLQDQPVAAGQSIRLEGFATVARTRNGFRLGVLGPVVDNNGSHALVEKNGTVYLPAGRHPFRLNWFNGINQYGLAVAYAGPDLPRQPIPSTALFLDPTQDAPGVAYAVYDVPGEVLPDFSQLTPLKQGTTADFAPAMLPHPEHVGVAFTGWLAVPRPGFYTFFTKSDDGSQLFIGQPAIHPTVLGTTPFPAPRRMALGQTLAAGSDFSTDLQWTEVAGTVTFACRWAGGWHLDLASDTGRLRVEVADGTNWPATPLTGWRLRAVGVCQSTRTTDGQRVADTLLVASPRELEWIPPAPPAASPGNSNELPVLTTAAGVHQLKREEAQRGYPVNLHGVVTCVLPEHQAFTLQDSTRGLYIEDHSASRPFPPRIGEFLAVAGTTDPSKFAPIVNARQLTSWGAGHLPEPVHPTWDQLLNGSLDAQYAELEGILTKVSGNHVTLLTQNGRIGLELRLADPQAGPLEPYQDALLHIRGCLLANWDYVTHEVIVGEIRMYDASISVSRAVPADLFARPAKTVMELLQFDPQASGFQQARVAGQIIHGQGREFYLTDGRNGLRFITRLPVECHPGDRVEVVGFPDLGGPSPLLQEAVIRRTGQAPLPDAPLLPAGQLARANADASRVRVQGVLASLRETRTEDILEIQSGVRTFAARLIISRLPLRAPPVGSLLELTGTYASLGANRAGGQDIAAFELLLNSPADIHVLARPPWWTLKRLLIIVGALLCGLAATTLWITQLHRRVEQRTAELAVQIQKRQQVEQQHAMEQERARVAQDLHDELGSGLTEISMLSARARSATATEEKRAAHLEQMSRKAREMVTVLDEIVWAMNPRHDSLASLVSYFCLYADRFLSLASIAWRLEGSPAPDPFAVDSRHRHQLFLAFKEGLTNVVRHSGATEVRLAIGLDQGQIRLSITDNGRGLPAAARTEEMDGLNNMRARLEKLGGRFEIASPAGQGTTLRFYLPVQST